MPASDRSRNDEKYACPLCRADAPVIEAKDKSYSRCARCGLIALLPGFRPGPETERARYLLHRNSPGDPGFLRFLGTFVDALLPHVPPGASVLDYGSGPDPVLAGLFEARGFAVTAWDPFFAPGDPAANAPYDLVIAHETAEHFFSPGDEFRRIASLVKPSGTVAVRTKLAPEGKEAFARWWYREDSTHVSFYTERSLPWVAAILGAGSFALAGGDTVIFRLGRADSATSLSTTR
ncbi:MAG: class I SAM-dependent methyltransferase [Spirochaetes bacterium]|nr:class I SAM-dependent methyltransferase [Spirochaetota bacterium]